MLSNARLSFICSLDVDRLHDSAAVRSPRSAPPSGDNDNQQRRLASGISRRSHRRPASSSSHASVSGNSAAGAGATLAHLQYYERPVRHCLSNADCEEFGESCLQIYDGCSRGRCMCDPRSLTPSSFTSSSQLNRFAQTLDRRRWTATTTASGSSSKTGDFGSEMRSTSTVSDSFHCGSTRG